MVGRVRSRRDPVEVISLAASVGAALRAAFRASLRPFPRPFLRPTLRASPRPSLRAALCAALCATLLGGCAITPREAGERIERLVDAASAEWQLWGNQRVRDDPQGALCAQFADGSCLPVDDGCGREMSSRHCALVNRYWPVVSAYRHPCDLTDQCVAQRPADLRPVYTEPWSAAFISFLYRRAGFGRFRFVFSDTHADYVSAVRDGLLPDFELLPAPFAPRRGDLLCSARGTSRGLSPAQIPLIEPQWSGPGFTRMHCDLVVEIDPRRRLAALIGGNVAQAVSLREIELDASGRVDWSPAPGPGWLLGLRLKAAGAADDARADAVAR